MVMVQRKLLAQPLTSGKVSTRSSYSFRRYSLLKTLTKSFNVKVRDLDLKDSEKVGMVQHKSLDQYLIQGKVSTKDPSKASDDIDF